MSILPIWARKPKHKKEVVATKRGWEVKETGELLVSNRRLDEKLKALITEIQDLDITTDVTVDVTPDTVDDKDELSPDDSEQNELDVILDSVDDQDDNKESTEEPEIVVDEKPVIDEELNKKEEVKEKPKKRRGRPPKNKNVDTNKTK